MYTSKPKAASRIRNTKKTPRKSQKKAKMPILPLLFSIVLKV